MYREPVRAAIDATFTTRPQRRSTMPGRNALRHRNAPVVFTVRTRVQSSRLVLWTGAPNATPALLTRISTRPRVSRALAERRSLLPGSATSHAVAFAVPASSSHDPPARPTPPALLS